MPKKLLRGAMRARKSSRAVAKISAKPRAKAKKPGLVGKAVGLAKKYPKTAAAAGGVVAYKAGKSAGARKERKRRR